MNSPDNVSGKMFQRGSISLLHTYSTACAQESLKPRTAAGEALKGKLVHDLKYSGVVPDFGIILKNRKKTYLFRARISEWD